MTLSLTSHSEYIACHIHGKGTDLSSHMHVSFFFYCYLLYSVIKQKYTIVLLAL